MTPGLDIRANVYPYTAGQNNLSSIIPPWAHDGGREKLLERLRDPGARRRMRTEILNGLPGWYNHYLATGDGWGGMQLVSLTNARNAPFQGKRMAELIAARGGDPVEVLFDVLLEEKRQRADRLLPPFRAGHAAGDEAAVDVDRIRRQRRQRRRLDRSKPSAPALLRHLSLGCSGATFVSSMS